MRPLSETAVRETKMLKVLKRISQLVEIPRNMKERAASLLGKWKAILYPPLVIDLTDESFSEPSSELETDQDELCTSHSTSSKSVFRFT